MSIDNGPLDVVKVGIVLKGTLKKAGFFTELGNSSTVVVSEHLITKDGVSNLRSGHEVHFQQTGLQVTLRRAIVLQCIEKERSALLHKTLFHEDVNNLLQVNKGLLVLNEHLSELEALIRVDTGKVA